MAGPALIKEGDLSHTPSLLLSVASKPQPQTLLPENRFQYKLLATGGQPSGILPVAAGAARHSCDTRLYATVFS